MYPYDTTKTIAKAYLSNRKCSVQEPVYHILSELKLRRIFLAVYFNNTNPPEERVQVLLSEKELSKTPDNGPNIFQKSKTDCYMERPSATFCNRKYGILDNSCQGSTTKYIHSKTPIFEYPFSLHAPVHFYITHPLHPPLHTYAPSITENLTTPRPTLHFPHPPHHFYKPNISLTFSFRKLH